MYGNYSSYKLGFMNKYNFTIMDLYLFFIIKIRMNWPISIIEKVRWVYPPPAPSPLPPHNIIGHKSTLVAYYKNL